MDVTTRRTEMMNTKLMFPTADTPRPGPTKAAAGRCGSLRAKWRCFRHTFWAHEVDLHAGKCRFCGKRVEQRL
jgi:hypothetical protein